MTDKELSKQAKAYLSETPKAQRLIRRLQSTIDSLSAGLTGQSYGQTERVQHSGSKRPIEETFTQIAQLETDIQEEVTQLNAWRREAIARINRVEDSDQRNVLFARYIEDKRWERIASEMNFSDSHIYRIHGDALLSFIEKNQDILKDESK